MLDVARAFPSLLHEQVFECILLSGAPSWLVRCVKSLYASMSGRFLFKGALSHSFSIRRGTRQGCPLSALLFVWTLDCFVRWSAARLPPSSGLSLFADDIAVVLSSIHTHGRDLLMGIEAALYWACGLSLNHGKIKCVPLTASMS